MCRGRVEPERYDSLVSGFSLGRMYLCSVSCNGCRGACREMLSLPGNRFGPGADLGALGRLSFPRLKQSGQGVCRGAVE